MMVNNRMWNINLDVVSYSPFLLMMYAYALSAYILKLYLKIGTGVEHNDNLSFERIQEDSGEYFDFIIYLEHILSWKYFSHYVVHKLLDAEEDSMSSHHHLYGDSACKSGECFN